MITVARLLPTALWQEKVVGDEKGGARVHREEGGVPDGAGYDVETVERGTWGRLEDWQLGIGLAFIVFILLFAFFRWQARSQRRGS